MEDYCGDQMVVTACRSHDSVQEEAASVATSIVLEVPCCGDDAEDGDDGWRDDE
jgi:hypothetical protein